MQPATALKFSVHHEWGALREVIVGIGQDAVVPKWYEGLAFMAAETQQFCQEYGGRPMSDYDPQYASDLIEQEETLAAILGKLGIQVHRVSRLSEPERSDLTEAGEGVQTFARDAIIVIGDKIIEASLKLYCRRRERWGFRNILNKLLIDQDYANWVSVPPASPDPRKNEGPFLEGGDTFLNGFEIYVGISGLASDLKGAKWLQGYLGPSYSVMPVRLRRDVLHLDCCMALLKPGLGLICRPKILDPLPGQLKDFEFVEVSEEEAHHLGTNVLVLDERRVIMDSKFERIAEALRNKGQEVILTPYQAPSFLGGGFRCSHHPIRRDSELS